MKIHKSHSNRNEIFIAYFIEILHNFTSAALNSSCCCLCKHIFPTQCQLHCYCPSRNCFQHTAYPAGMSAHLSAIVYRYIHIYVWLCIYVYIYPPFHQHCLAVVSSAAGHLHCINWIQFAVATFDTTQLGRCLLSVSCCCCYTSIYELSF